MQEKRANFYSSLCVAVALVMLLSVFACCYPTVREQAWEVFAGDAEGAVWQAFHALQDGVEGGEPVREALSQSVQVLLHGES